MIPANLLLLAWAWFGRLAFGVGGWFLLILLPVIALLFLGLLLTTILALTQPGSPKALTGPQSLAQLTLWLGLFGFGLFLPDFGDAPDSTTSLLTRVFGYSEALIDVGMALAGLFGLLVLVAYVVLLSLLLVGRRRA